MRLPVSHDTLGTVFSTVCRALTTNLLLVLGNLPAVAVLCTTDVARSWPLLLALAPLCVPTLVAASAVFAEPDSSPVPVFVRAWRRALRTGTLLGTLSTAALAVLVVDVRAVFGSTVGAVAVPVLVVAAALVAATTVHGVVALALVPTARLRDVLLCSGYAAVRRWYLTAFSLAVLCLLVHVVATWPVLGLGLATAPMLYVVWADCQHALRPALVPSHHPTTPESP